MQVFYCTVCQLPTDSEDRVRQHLQSHHSELTGGPGLKCEECGQVCRSEAALERHRLLHPSLPAGRAERCKGCGKTFSTSVLLAYHEEGCSFYRPYRCE